jgi:hypothetical protein
MDRHLLGVCCRSSGSSSCVATHMCSLLSEWCILFDIQVRSRSHTYSHPDTLQGGHTLSPTNYTVTLISVCACDAHTHLHLVLHMPFVHVTHCISAVCAYLLHLPLTSTPVAGAMLINCSTRSCGPSRLLSGRQVSSTAPFHTCHKP